MKTKFLFLISFFILQFTLITFHCSGQDWLWAKQIGGSSSVSGGARIDANNNIYCSGIFYGSCYFEHDTLTALGYNDLFLAKFDDNGNELWAKRIGGVNPSGVKEYGGIAILDSSNACLYYNGRFYGSLTIDGHTVNSSGGLDMFIAKFDLAGNCLWLKKAGSGGDDDYSALCIDVNGDLYATGQLCYDNGVFDTISLPQGIFLAKIDSVGNILWARNEISGGTALTSINTMKIISNNILIAGVASNNIIIGTTPVIANNSGGFIARLDLNGNCIDVKRFGGHSVSYAGNFVTDTNSNIYLSGIFQDTLIIDGTTLTNDNGSWEMYFCKFDSAFNLNWIRQSYSTGALGAHAYGLIEDIEGKFYISGSFSGNATFGIFNLNSSVTKDMFLARYDENGNCIGIRHFGEAVGGNVNIDSYGNLIVAGGFNNTVNIGNTTLTSISGQDMFFAKATPITSISVVQKNANYNLLIYANPTTGKCNITVPDDFVNERNLTLSIFDNTGKLIQQQKLEMSEDKIKLNMEVEAKGIYTAVLSNGKKSYTGKIVFE